MRFSLNQLLAFVTACELGSFSRAARQLGKAQSAVSTAVANLELELDLDMDLFDRSGREPQMTDAARALLPQIRALLDQARDLQGHADAMAQGEEGQLTLAVEESLIGPELERMLVRFEQIFPQLELEFLNPARMDIVDLVKQGRVDMGLLLSTLQPPEGCRLRAIGEMTLIAVAGIRHPLADRRLLLLDDLKPYRQLVLTSRGAQMRVSEQIGRQVWRIESQFSLLEMVRQGIGWAWVPQHMVREEIAAGRLCRLHCDLGADRYHIPVDLLLAFNYLEGKAGQWLYREIGRLPFLEGGSNHSP
ncbi:MAG: LysR family transcriptional regulator [Candidatus Thiodiazotropha sp.]